jgi:hypothetical protein
MEGSLSDKYSIGECLVSTRSADLFRGTRIEGGQEVFIWLLRHTIQLGSKAADRFNNRMEIIKSLDPVPVPILEHGVDEGGIAFAVIGHIEGGPLAVAHYDKQQLEWLVQECVRWVGLLHSKGLVCGDLTQASFWIQPDWSVSLIGIMGSFDVEAESTTAAPPVETYHFLAPEQRSGAGAEQASDVYALGVLSYLLTSQQFPIGDSKKILLGAPNFTEIKPLQSMREDLPAWAPIIVQRTLAPTSQGRFQSVAELLECLEAIVGGAPAEKYLVGESQVPVVTNGRDELVQKRGRDGLVRADSSAHLPINEESEASLQGYVQPNPAQTRASLENLLDDNRSVPPVWMVGVGAIIGLIAVSAIIGLALVFFTAPLPETGSVPVVVGAQASGMRALMDELAVATDVDSAAKAVRLLIEAHGREGYHEIIKLLSDAHLKGDAHSTLIEGGVLNYIRAVHGEAVSETLKGSLANGSLNSCYSSSFMLFAPELNEVDRESFLADCHAVAPLSSIVLLAAKSLDSESPESWRDMFGRIATETLGLTGEETRSVPAIVLAHKELRIVVPETKQADLIHELNDPDLLWVFSQLTAEDVISFGLVARELTERGVIKPPRSSFIEPFMDGQLLEPKLRDGLLRAVTGTIDEELVNAAGLWLDERSGVVLLAACALAESEEVHQKAFDAMSNRRIRIAPAGNLIRWIRKNSWADRSIYSRIVCKSGFFESLEEAEQEKLVDSLGGFVNENKFIEIILDSDSVNLIRRLTEKYGKNFSLHLLMKLLDSKDKQTRIYAVQHLKYYNNLIVLRRIVEQFRAEKDPEVKEAYRENFWVVRQSEQRAGGLEASD